MSTIDLKMPYAEPFDYRQVYEATIKYSPNGIVLADMDHNIRYINPVAEKLTGKSTLEVVGKNFYDIFPHISPISLDSEDAGSELNSGVIRMNGGELHSKFFSIKTEKKVPAYILILQDMRQIYELTSDLRTSKHVIEELEEILEGSFDGFLVADEKGIVQMMNKSYERLTGITRDELLGRDIAELVNPVWMKKSVVVLALEAKKSISLSHTTRNKKNIIVTGTPVFNAQGEIKRVIVNARDISEIYELREELLKAKEMEKLYFSNLKDESYLKGKEDGFVVFSEAMQEVFSLAKKVSCFDATVLLLGESGVGKEVIAKFLHNNSLRKDKPFVTVNCGAIPENLLEAELFGYEGGSFTGASREGKIGLFEAAEGGTLFLDEIGEMALNLQVKLLRALETREILRVGSVKPIATDVRILAATNQDLDDIVKRGEFRKDLYYRLNVIQIYIPPLRERIDDIAPLALHFLQLFNGKYGLSKKLTYDLIKELEDYPWEGNIRQLKNIIENIVIVSNNEYLQPNDLPWHSRNEESKAAAESERRKEVHLVPLEQAVEQLERQILLKARDELKSTRKIADVLEVDQSTIVRKMKKYGISQK